MKSGLRSVLTLVAVFAFSLASAQSKQYYVVIGAFAKESNAKKFSGFARSRFFQATYEINPARNLYYVYVIKSTVKKEAIDQVLILQKEKAFNDSWVFAGSLGKNTQPKPIAQLQPEPVKAKPTAEPITPKDTVASIPSDPPKIDSIRVDAPEPEVKVVNEAAPRKAKGKFFKFTIVSPTGEAFSGNVHHVDLRKGRDLASYPGNVYSDVPSPANREEPMTFICGIFGYKEITQVVDYTNPQLAEGATQDENGVWTIPFKLERLHKGDVSVMYDVSFYKDAVVMLPRAQEELDELVNMMANNTAYKIKIHGHTNGNSKRKIIALGNPKNYFDIKGSKQKNGTSKQLSKERAEAIRDYLTEHGIDSKRIELMAWGGTNMLVAETSPSARLNDRIEIEILED